MILQIMVYSIVVAAVLGVAGLCLERLAMLRGLPRRAAWSAALLLSVLLPAIMILRAEPARTAPPAAASVIQHERVVAGLPDRRSIDGAPIAPRTAARQAAEPARAWHLPRLSDRGMLQAWAIASLLSVLHLIGAHLRLRRRISGWQRATLLDHPVLISESMGPALVGVFGPRMVIPRWLLDEPATTQSLILEHERQHVAARDPLLIRAGVVLLAALPWNLPLWWQWRRLRQAIELDCDARVLRTGAEARTYGEVLLTTTGRAVRMPSGVIAMSEPVSALERRIQNLLPDPVRHAALQTSGAIALLIAGVGVAVAVNAPALPARAPSQTISAQPAATAPPTAPPPAVISLAAAAAAPAVRTTDLTQPDAASRSTAAPDGTELSPFDKAMRAAVLKYPQLIEGTPRFRDLKEPVGGDPAMDSYTSLTILVRADGTHHASLLGATAQWLPWLPPGTEDRRPRLFDKVREGIHTAKIPKGQPIGNLGKASDNIEANWYVLRADYDESRDVTHVRDAVQARHADLMLPYRHRPDLDAAHANINVLTVFMTDDGQLAREVVESRGLAEIRAMDPPPMWITSLAMSDFFIPPSVPAEAFKVLGLNAEQIGQTGLLLVEPALQQTGIGPLAGVLPPAALPTMQNVRFIRSVIEGVQVGDPDEAVVVRYAWPRRPGEPVGGKAPTGTTR